MRRITIACLIGLVSSPAALASSPLSGEAIKDRVAGKRIYLKIPLGGEFPLYYQTNGVVNGSGEAVGLGRFMRPKDSGKWWINGNRLCQQWQTWYDGKPFCFTITDNGPSQIKWKRDDGLAGTARIGN